MVGDDAKRYEGKAFVGSFLAALTAAATAALLLLLIFIGLRPRGHRTTQLEASIEVDADAISAVKEGDK